MNLYTEQQMRDAIKMARNGARSEDNIIDSLNFIKQHSEVTMSNNKQSIHLREMKYIWGILKDSFALKMICSIFDHDAHHIVSKKGWKKLKS